MAIALTGMGAVILLLTYGFAPALQEFVKLTGISLPTADLGWAPLAVIAWGVNGYSIFCFSSHYCKYGLTYS